MRFVCTLKNEHGTTVEYVELSAWRDVEAWTEEFLHSVCAGFELSVYQKTEEQK